MDSRITLNVDESFLHILESCFEHKEKVHLLLDENGMVRTEGFINNIHKGSTNISIKLEDGRTIDLRSVIAVNGIFRPEYGEC